MILDPGADQEQVFVLQRNEGLVVNHPSENRTLVQVLPEDE